MAEVYIPDHESQTDERAPTPWTNCTFAAGAMLIDWWTWGRVETSDMELRQASGIPVHLGANYAALHRAILAVTGLRLLHGEPSGSGTDPVRWHELRSHLANGGASCVAGDYAALAPYRSATGLSLTRWQPGGTFGHNMLAVDYRPAPEGDGRVLILDPLGRGDYAGDRAPLEALWAFLWKSGNTADALVAAAHGFSGTRPTSPDTGSWEQRVIAEVRELRARHPAAARRWRERSQLSSDRDGRPLRRVWRVSAERLYLRTFDE